ncbi:MAG: MFS transporter [Anaerolineales bacterium]|nr:MFS transporter [Anaerolineales bacterium]
MKKWGPLITLSFAMFIIVIDTTIMNVSISALVLDLNTTVTGIQSAISVYALVMAAFILIGGKLADIFGKKRVFMVGLVIYGLGTTIASFSTSLPMLIFGWSFLEGLGGALMMPNVQVLLKSEYEGADLAFGYGMIGAVGAIGAAVGPIVGGFFTTYFSWRWAFRTEVLIVLLVLVLSRTLTRDTVVTERPKFDFVGALLSVFGWSGIVLGILLAQTYGFFLAKEPFMLGSLAIAPLGLSISPVLVGLGLLLIILLIQWETRLEQKQAAGLFRPSIFKAEGITAGLAVRFLHLALMAAFLYVFPLLLQLSFDYTAIETGLALMPYSIGLLAMALLGARLSSRFTARQIIRVGFGITAVGLLMVGLTIRPESSASDLALGAVLGMGLGLIASQILNLILSSVAVEQTAETSGITGTFEQLGNAIGVALVGTIMLTTLSGVLQNQIAASTLAPGVQQELVTAVEQGVQLMSNTQLEQNLVEVGASPEQIARVTASYHVARTDAFRAGIALLIFVALSGFVLAGSLPNRKLVATEAAP